MAASRLRIACLCAAWCGVCGGYRAAFDAVRAECPEADFLWIDVEDEAARLDPVDVENFPTVLISQGADVLFFGTLTPQRQTLQRVVQAKLVEGASAGVVDDAALRALVSRLSSRPVA